MKGKYLWKFDEDANGRPTLESTAPGLTTIFILTPWLDQPVSWLLEQMKKTEANIDESLAKLSTK